MDDATAVLERPYTLDGPSLHRLAVQAARKRPHDPHHRGERRTGGFETVQDLLDFAELQALPWRFHENSINFIERDPHDD